MSDISGDKPFYRLYTKLYQAAKKDESLSYEWFAAAGEIILGEPANTATWTAPNESGIFSVSCSVSDNYFGLDIAIIEIIVE